MENQTEEKQTRRKKLSVRDWPESERPAVKAKEKGKAVSQSRRGAAGTVNAKRGDKAAQKRGINERKMFVVRSCLGIKNRNA